MRFFHPVPHEERTFCPEPEIKGSLIFLLRSKAVESLWELALDVRTWTEQFITWGCGAKLNWKTDSWNRHAGWENNGDR